MKKAMNKRKSALTKPEMVSALTYLMTLYIKEANVHVSTKHEGSEDKVIDNRNFTNILFSNSYFLGQFL